MSFKSEAQKIWQKEKGNLIFLAAFATLIGIVVSTDQNRNNPDYNDSVLAMGMEQDLHKQWQKETIAAKSQITDFERLTQTRTEVSEAVLGILYENPDKTPYQCMQLYEDKYNPEKKDPYKTLVAQDLRVYSVSVSRSDFDYLLQAYPYHNPNIDRYLTHPHDARYRDGLEYYFASRYPELKIEPRVDRHTLQKMYIQQMKAYERD